MFTNILIPTDGSDLAAKAVEQGVLFAPGSEQGGRTVKSYFPSGPHIVEELLAETHSSYASGAASMVGKSVTLEAVSARTESVEPARS